MRKSTIITIVVVVAALLGFGAYSLSQRDSSTANTGTQQEQAANSITFSEDGKTVTYPGEEGVTALATLQSLTSVATEKSSFGEFVTAINDVTADSSKEYWSFYANGAYANEGAGTYTAKAGDSFSWQLEQLQ